MFVRTYIYTVPYVHTYEWTSIQNLKSYKSLTWYSTVRYGTVRYFTKTMNKKERENVWIGWVCLSIFLFHVLIHHTVHISTEIDVQIVLFVNAIDIMTIIKLVRYQYGTIPYVTLISIFYILVRRTYLTIFNLLTYFHIHHKEINQTNHTLFVRYLTYLP